MDPTGETFTAQPGSGVGTTLAGIVTVMGDGGLVVWATGGSVHGLYRIEPSGSMVASPRRTAVNEEPGQHVVAAGWQAAAEQAQARFPVGRPAG